MSDTFVIESPDVFSSMNRPAFSIYNPPSSSKVVSVSSLEVVQNQWVLSTEGSLSAYRMTSPVVGNHSLFTLVPLNAANTPPAGVAVSSGLDGGTGLGGASSTFRSHRVISSSPIPNTGQVPIGYRLGMGSRRKHNNSSIQNHGEIFVFANSNVEPITLGENEAFVLGSPSATTSVGYPFWFAVVGILVIGTAAYAFSGNVATAQATQWPCFAITNASGSGVTVKVVDLSFVLTGDQTLSAMMGGPWWRIFRGRQTTGGEAVSVIPLNSADTPTVQAWKNTAAYSLDVQVWKDEYNELVNPEGLGWQAGWPKEQNTAVWWHSPSIRPGLLRHLLIMPRVNYDATGPTGIWFSPGMSKASEGGCCARIELYPGESLAVGPDYNSPFGGLVVRAVVIETPLPAKSEAGSYGFVG